MTKKNKIKKKQLVLDSNDVNAQNVPSSKA